MTVSSLSQVSSLTRSVEASFSKAKAEELFRAMSQSDEEEALAILDEAERFIDPNWRGDGTPSEPNMPLLYMAALRGQVQVIKRLLGLKAGFERNTHHGSTPLHAALESGNKEAVNELIIFEKDLGRKGNEGETYLVCAVKGGNPDVVRLLFDMNRGNVAVNVADAYGTPLHYLASVTCLDKMDERTLKLNPENQSEILEIGKLLVENGADLTSLSGRKGNTPLHEAVYLCDGCGTFLVEFFARKLKEKKIDPLSLENNNGRNVLDYLRTITTDQELISDVESSLKQESEMIEFPSCNIL